MCCILSSIYIRYQNKTPPDLEVRIHHLKVVLAHLGGRGGPNASTTTAPAPKEVSSLLGKLDAACAEITQGLHRLKKDGPRLEGHLANLASVCKKQE